MFAFLRLVRLPNLIIIAFTQYMVRWFLIYPIYKSKGWELQLSNFYFLLLVISTVTIAAAGYIINDYFDLNIDKINKPERVVINQGVKRRVAIVTHLALTFVAIVIGSYVSYRVGALRLVAIHIISATGLWFYSTDFKRQFLIGNLIVASFVLLVPLVVGIYEFVSAFKYYTSLGSYFDFIDVWHYVLGISFFAGIITLLREIIKDIEDSEGDAEYGCKTLPIVVGTKNAKLIASGISFVTMLCLAYLQLSQWKSGNLAAFYYFVFALQLPFGFLIFLLLKAETKQHFHLAGNLCKIIMLLGVCYLFVFNSVVNTHLHAI